MSDFNPREPIRLSDIDNLLEDSIFNSSNGAKLAEYLKKKRGGGGRVRLHNIFEQVAANMPKPTFNFDMNSSEPNPLPESPQTAEQPEPVATTSAKPVQNGNVIVEVLVSTPPTEPPAVVAVPDARPASPKPVGKSPAPLANLGRQALLNQYHRTNMAKCELLKQITSSTPKPEINGSMSRISAFTTSISPIIEYSSSPAVVPQQAVAPQPVVDPDPISSILPVESVPPTQQVLAPCSQVPPTSTPQKVVIIGTPVQPGPPSPEMLIPETPSPVNVPSESPKLAHQIQPRKLTDTFNQLQNDMVNVSNENENITSDESGSIEEEHPVVPKVSHLPSTENSIMRKSILKDADASSINRRASLRVSFSQQLVQEREISPAPSIPEAHYSSSSDDDDSSDSSDEEYQVVDEVYSDDGGEFDPKDNDENYQELIEENDCLEKQVLEIPERIPSPLINVVDEAPVRWYETRTPRATSNEGNNGGLALLATCAKENKTNLQLVDIITDWDEEDDDEEEEEKDKQEEQEKSPEKELSAIEILETQPSTQHTNETICETMDITNVEDSAERLVELPPPPVSFNGSTQEPPVSPERPLTPPSQFTDSAKRRFLRENDEALLSRLQNELPVSQQEEQSPDTPDLVPGTLVEIVQSFRDQPQPKPDDADKCRKTIVPARKGRRTKSTVDPATTTYFETVEKPFVKPTAPPNKSVTVKPLTTAQKRKLYATTKQPKSPEKLTSSSLESFTANMKTINIVLRRLEVDEIMLRLNDADRAILEGTTKAPITKPKPKPNLRKGKKVSKKDRIVNENGNVQKQPSEALECGTSSDSNEPIFAGFAENEKVQSAPEELEKLLHDPKIPLDSSNAVSNSEPKEELNPQDGANVEKVHSKPAKPHRKRNGSKKEGSANAGVQSVRNLRSKGKKCAEEKLTEEVVDSNAEIRLTSSDGKDTQQRIPEATNQPTEIEQENVEEIVSRKKLTTDSVENIQTDFQHKKTRGRPRRGANVAKSLVSQTEIVDKQVVNENQVLQNGENSTGSSSLATVHERLESVSSTSATGESAPFQLTLPDIVPQESATSLSGDNEDPSKAKQPVPAKDSTDSELHETAVTSTSSGIEAPLNAESVPEINTIGSSESVAPVSSSSNDGIGSSENKKDAESLPFKKRTLRHGSVDEPPTLEPFGSERGADEISDNEPPLLVPHDPVPSTSSRSKRKKAETHPEKHTTEKPEKKPWWLSRYYQDRTDETDKTWIPGGKKQKDNYNRRVRNEKVGGRSGSSGKEVECESQPVRRGSRQRRLAKSALIMNPNVKSVYDRPVYRQMSAEELLQVQHRIGEEKRPRKKTKATSTDSSTVPKGVNRKRTQEEPEEPIMSKRNRPDNEGEQMAQPENVQITPVPHACPLPTETNAATEPAPPTDRLVQEKIDTYGWIHKLMHGNLDEDPRLPVVGDLVQYSLQHLSFKEHNGIQYSFYLRSESENFGFLRFAPSAVKKLTKTSNFLLKFLVIAGKLSFYLNGNKISIASGDFLMLPENSKYGIENGGEVSLLFMVKMLSQSSS